MIGIIGGSSFIGQSLSHGLVNLQTDHVTYFRNEQLSKEFSDKITIRKFVKWSCFSGQVCG